MQDASGGKTGARPRPPQTGAHPPTSTPARANDAALRSPIPGPGAARVRGTGFRFGDEREKENDG